MSAGDLAQNSKSVNIAKITVTDEGKTLLVVWSDARVSGKM